VVGFQRIVLASFPATHSSGISRACSIGGRSDAEERQMAMLWVLNLSDGDHSLLEVAERAGLPFALVAEVAGALEAAGLLSRTAAG
jgi:aminopeptidase-like protein